MDTMPGMLWTKERVEKWLREHGASGDVCLAVVLASDIVYDYEAQLANQYKRIGRFVELVDQLERKLAEATEANSSCALYIASQMERIAELEARLAQTWQPLPDGEYDMGVENEPLYVFGNTDPDVCTHVEWQGETVMLDLGMTVCRLVERAEVQSNGWKSVNESLPEGHAWVLVYAEGAIDCMGYSPDKGFEDWTEQQAPNVNISEITHWKELQRPTEVDHE